MRRLATALLLLITGCSSSGSGSGSGAAASGTATAATAPGTGAASSGTAAAATAPGTGAASTAAAPPDAPTGAASDANIDAQLLAFGFAVQAMAPCWSDRDAPVCKDRKNLAWLTENVDWQLYHATELTLSIEGGDGSPDANQRVAQASIRILEEWKSPSLVAQTASQLGGDGKKPCKITPTSDEDRKNAKRALEVKAQQAGLSSDIVEKLDRVFARRTSYQKLHTLLCGEDRVVLAAEEGGKGRLLPIP